MESQLCKAIAGQGLILPGERILLALSGGPDSVCLFHLLLAQKASVPFELGIAHVNHGLRGMESDGEERFVRQLASEHGIPCFIHTEDVGALARRQGISFELAARGVRYDFFEKTMVLEGYTKTALAHHLNDQVETILHRLIRGSGLNGLAGMRPMREGRYIRPLLWVERSQIMAWLEENQLDYRLDSSNESREYTRNRIRLDLIPQLESFNPEAVTAIGNMSRSLQWDRDYLEKAAASLAEQAVHRQGDKVVIRSGAFDQPLAMTSRLIFVALALLKGDRLDLSVRQVEDILALQAGETGRRLDLPDQITVYNHYGQLEWSFKDLAAGSEDLEEIRLDITKLPVSVPFPPYTITLANVPPQGTAERVDAGTLTDHIIIRRRRPQDRMQLLGMTGRKKIKNIFIDRHIHRETRGRLPVFTDDSGGIFYIYPGICSQTHRITPNTYKILYITVTENY